MRGCLILIVLSLASMPAFGADSAADLFQHLAELEEDLATETRRLEALRDDVRRSRVGLGYELSEAEAEALALRAELTELQAERATSEELAKGPLGESRQARRTIDYLKTSLREFSVYFQSTVHLAEMEGYRPVFEALRAGQSGAADAVEPSAKSRLELWGDVFEGAVGHCESLSGGRLVPGRAVAGPEKEIVEGRFAIWGPLTLFGSDNGRVGGYATVPANRTLHHLIDTGDVNNRAIARFVRGGAGELPLDGTQGNAALLYATRDPLPEHISKGGPVMVGILTLGASAFFMALFKLIQVSRVRRVAGEDVDAILARLREGDEWEAMEIANRLKGPEGDVFRVGVSHYHKDSEELQLALVNTVSDAQAKLKAGAPFIAVAAALAPLFGLLGTVTGMINTFRLISVYGTGDPRMLSSGISESLITTEFGLVIAVPALLLHAAVAGRIKQLVQSMESKAIRFLVNRPPSQGGEPVAEGREGSPDVTPSERNLENPGSLNPVGVA